MTSTTPEIAPDIPPAQQRPPHINGAPDVLQIESLDRFLGADNNLRIASDGDTDAYNQGKIRLAQMIKDQLEASGITPDADNPEKNEEYEYAAGLLAEIVGMSEDEWMNREGTGRRNQIFRDLLTRYRPTPEIPEEEPTGPEDDYDDNERSIDTIRTELDQAREAWSVMQAKRQGRLWDRRIKGYNATKERYESLRDELGSRTLESTINDDTLNDVEKNAAVIAYIFDEQNALRSLTKEKVENTRVSKFVEKFGGWLNKGGGWTRFGKAAAVGMGAGIVGAGAGLLFGAAGMGAAVAGAGVLITKGALRFTKAYAKSDARQGRGMSNLDDSEKDTWARELAAQDGDTVVEKAGNLSGKKFEGDTKREQGKRQKTMTTAVLGLTLGAGLATGIGFALDGFGVSGTVRDSLIDRQSPVEPGDGDAGQEAPDIHTQEEIDEQIKEAEDRVRDEYDDKINELEDKIDELEGKLEDEIENPSNDNGDISDIPGDNGDYTDYILDHMDALNVASGEGWFQTFSELGISVEDHRELLAEVGPRLAEMNVAYVDASIGGYGIARPGDMPIEALQYILEVANERGIAVSGIGLPSAGV